MKWCLSFCSSAECRTFQLQYKRCAHSETVQKTGDSTGAGFSVRRSCEQHRQFLQSLVPTVQTVQKTTEIPQLHGSVVDVSSPIQRRPGVASDSLIDKVMTD